MRSLNPFSGEFYREALQVSRYTREMFCLMEGRHVHPSTLYPGGVGTTATIQLFTDYASRLMRYVEFMKRVVPLHDDLFDFFYEAMPGYEQVGNRRILLGCWGAYQDPDVCNFDYKDMTQWGRAMGVTPGVVVDGKLVTNDLVDINLGIRILLGSSYYQSWEDQEIFVTQGPARQPGRPQPPVEPDDDPPAAEARLRRQLQLGDVAALVRRQGPPRPRHRRRPAGQAVVDGVVGIGGSGRVCEGHGYERADQPAEDGARRARCRSSGRSRSGRTRSSATGLARTSRPTRPAPRCTSSTRRWPRSAPARPRRGRRSRCPTKAIGCGFTEAVRGVLSHHMVIRDGKIANYHPYPPTPWNANPRDVYGTPGPYEDAVQGCPIFEENTLDNFKGIDIMRTVRSFDPVPAVRRAHVPRQGPCAQQGPFTDHVQPRGSGLSVTSDRIIG